MAPVRPRGLPLSERLRRASPPSRRTWSLRCVRRLRSGRTRRHRGGGARRRRRRRAEPRVRPPLGPPRASRRGRAALPRPRAERDDTSRVRRCRGYPGQHATRRGRPPDGASRRARARARPSRPGEPSHEDSNQGLRRFRKRVVRRGCEGVASGRALRKRRKISSYAGEVMARGTDLKRARLSVVPFRPEHADGFRSLVADTLQEFGFEADPAIDPDLDDPAATYAAFWIAADAGDVVGSVALRELGDGAVELKRMY